MTDHRISTSDGRTLQVLESGAPDGRAVLFHTGTPNSRLMYANDVAVAKRMGVRLISYDRPGYGGSDPQPGRSVADCTGDVRTIAAALGIERLGVMGWSGGGPHALACAALLEDLVPAVVSIASPAPYGADGLDYFDGMGKANVDGFRLRLSDPDAARLKTAALREQAVNGTPEQLLEMLSTLLSPVDAAVLTGDYAAFLASCDREGLAPGHEGWWDDGQATSAIPWGFELSSIRTPVLLLHGRQDRFVPFGHGEWLARQIPGVEAWLTEEDGHMTFLHNELQKILGWLMERI